MAILDGGQGRCVRLRLSDFNRGRCRGKCEAIRVLILDSQGSSSSDGIGIIGGIGGRNGSRTLSKAFDRIVFNGSDRFVTGRKRNIADLGRSARSTVDDARQCISEVQDFTHSNFRLFRIDLKLISDDIIYFDCTGSGLATGSSRNDGYTRGNCGYLTILVNRRDLRFVTGPGDGLVNRILRKDLCGQGRCLTRFKCQGGRSHIDRRDRVGSDLDVCGSLTEIGTREFESGGLVYRAEPTINIRDGDDKTSFKSNLRQIEPECRIVARIQLNRLLKVHGDCLRGRICSVKYRNGQALAVK